MVGICEEDGGVEMSVMLQSQDGSRLHLRDPIVKKNHCAGNFWMEWQACVIMPKLATDD